MNEWYALSFLGGIITGIFVKDIILLFIEWIDKP